MDGIKCIQQRMKWKHCKAIHQQSINRVTWNPSGVERIILNPLNYMMVGRNQMYSMEYNHRNWKDSMKGMIAATYFNEYNPGNK